MTKILQYDPEIKTNVPNLFIDPPNHLDNIYLSGLRNHILNDTTDLNRYNLTRFITQLLKSNIKVVEKILIDSRILDKCFDYFFSSGQKHNTLLQICIVDLIRTLLSNASNETLGWIKEYDLISKIKKLFILSDDTVSLLPHFYSMLEILCVINLENYIEYLTKNQDWSEMINGELFNHIKNNLVNKKSEWFV